MINKKNWVQNHGDLKKLGSKSGNLGDHVAFFDAEKYQIKPFIRLAFILLRASRVIEESISPTWRPTTQSFLWNCRYGAEKPTTLGQIWSNR